MSVELVLRLCGTGCWAMGYWRRGSTVQGDKMWFGILGPLLVRDEDVVIEVPAARQRVLLAALLVHAGQVVPADKLAEMAWDGAPPPGATVTLRSHVSRLRRVLGPRARLVTRYPGYLIEAGQEEVDLLRFACLCRDGAAAVRAGAWPQAYGMLGEALGFWRGDPFADVQCRQLHRDEIPGLEQMRLQAYEWRNEAGLHLGYQEELVPDLQSLTARHPLREKFHGQLMLALYRCGRQAEALSAYQDARRLLVEELGSEPGADLRKLHQRILRVDPALAAPEPAPSAAGRPEPAVPRELPPGIRHFTGRSGELAALTGLMDRFGDEMSGTVVISAISGTAGVGKTALAVHWAHQVAHRFPDGQLYVNLRGYDLGQPMTVADALAGFLRALGVPAHGIPAEEAECAARYRSLLAGRRMLVVLDNASKAEQVRPLLPGTSTCAAVVTSRDSLAGLIARDGATRLDLDLLPLTDAVGLLRALIGARADAEPKAALALADRCCRLPLALRVAAELAAACPAVSLAHLAGELADHQRRLDVLHAGGDSRTAVRSVFSWSYRHLDACAARAFRLAALHPGPDLDRYAAAALTGGTLEQSGRDLDTLARAHLIQLAGPGRYTMHSLLRAYARELAEAQDAEEDRRTALTRLFDCYLASAAASMDALAPAERHRRPSISSPATPLPPLQAPDAASEWLRVERAALTAIADHTATRGWPGHTIRLSTVLFRYYRDIGCHYADARAVHTHALHAAGQIGDRPAQAEALMNRGMVDLRLGCYQPAASQIGQALGIYLDVGDRSGQARAHSNLGVVLWEWARFQLSADHFRQALAVHRELGDRFGQATALDNLGTALARQGHYQQAADHHQQAVDLCQELGHRRGRARALANLGAVLSFQGRCQEAVGHLVPALAVFREFGDRNGEADVLNDLGAALYGQGQYDQAVSHHQRALAIFRELGVQNGETAALNALGEAFLAAGQFGDALTQHTSALGLASQTGDRYQQARAHNGLAHAYHAAGHSSQAHHWRKALTLYTSVGAPEADQVRAQLAAVNDGHRGVPL